MSKTNLNLSDSHHCPKNRWNPRTWSAGKKVVALVFIVVVLLGLCAMLRPDSFFIR